MRRLLALLSVLLLAPEWVWAVETTGTTPAITAEAQPASAVHSTTKKGTGQTASSKTQASKKGGSTAVKSSKGKKSSRGRR